MNLENLQDYNIIQEKLLDKIYWKKEYCLFKKQYYYVDKANELIEHITGINYQKANAIISRTCRNKNKKRNRLKEKLTKLIEDNEECIFATLTFNDKYINCKSHRKLVTDFLNENSKNGYIANIDFGTKKERMHYHAVLTNKINPKLWRYGACNVKTIYKKNSEYSIAEYITKFTNHSTKTTTRNSRVIYSRKKENKQDE